MTRDPVAAVLARYGQEGGRVEPVTDGLINDTYRITTRFGEVYALQRVNPMFPPSVNDNIETVTAYLHKCGLTTPRLRETLRGKPSVHLDGDIWRMLTWIEGETLTNLTEPRPAAEAGALLGRFHVALAGLNSDLESPRASGHDTKRHLQFLQLALQDYGAHRAYANVVPLAREILAAADAIVELPLTPERLVHGDPKISNIIFARDTGQALCLIDLDTLARMPLPLELGDAFRSWCNPAGEDSRDTSFSPELFAAAVQGYAAATEGWITKAEQQSMVPATYRIYVELAARFCADALREDYFAWDPSRFTSHSEHSEVRAAGQLAAARSLLDQRGLLEEIVAKAFS